MDVPVEGVISFAGDADAFQFTATVGQIITLKVDGRPVNPFFNLILSLYNSDLQPVAEVPLFVPGFDSMLEGFEIPVDGTYYAEIKDTAGGRGADFTYTLTLTIEGGDGAGEFPPYDVNQDGKVDIFDLVLVGQHLGEKFINATPTADFGQFRSASPEGELRLLMTPSADRYTTIDRLNPHHSDCRSLRLPYFDPVRSSDIRAPHCVAKPGFSRRATPSYWHISQQGTELKLIQTRPRNAGRC